MPEIDMEALLNAIAQVESGNNPQAIGDQDLKYPAYGAYQMRYPAYQDVVRLNPLLRETPFEALQGDAELQRTFAEAYLVALRDNYGLQTQDEIVAGYNAGPSVRKTGIRNPGYVAKVNRHLKEQVP